MINEFAVRPAGRRRGGWLGWLVIALLLSAGMGQPAAADDWIARLTRVPPAPPTSRTIFRWVGQQDEDQPPKRDEPLAADRPDFTEASTTVGRGLAQVEMGYTFFRDRESGTTEEAHTYPEMLWRVGVLADWLELRLAHNHVNQTTDFPLLPDESASGPFDLYLGAKLALTDQEGWLPELALTPQMFVPTGHHAFTAGEVHPGLNLLFGWDLSEEVSLGGSTQGNKRLDPAGGSYFEFAQSLTCNFKLADHLGLYLEWFVLAPSGAVDVATEHYADGGFTFPITKNLQLDVRAGVGLNRAAINFFSGTGLAVRF